MDGRRVQVSLALTPRLCLCLPAMCRAFSERRSMKGSGTRRSSRLPTRSDQGNDDDTVRRLTFSVTLVENNSFPLRRRRRRTARYCVFSYFSRRGLRLQRRFHPQRKREGTASDAQAAAKNKKKMQTSLERSLSLSCDSATLGLFLFSPRLYYPAAVLTDYRIESVCFPLARIANSNEDRHTSTQ